MSILYTTHYMEEAQELSDRVGIIDHGELIALGTQEELTRQVNETDTLVLHIAENEDPQPLVNRLQTLDGVSRASVIDHEISIITRSAQELIDPAVQTAEAVGIKIYSVDISEPNLEAVFLHLTGRALRD